MTNLNSITAPSDTWDEEELEPENMAALAALSSDDDEDDEDDEDEEEVTSPDEGLEAPSEVTEEEAATPEDVLEAEEADELAALDRLERELKQDELGSMDDLLQDEDESS